MLFRELSPEEEKEFRESARKDYQPNSPISKIWHPVYVDECERINRLLISGGMFIHLYHGRENPNEQLQEWGFDGPIIGPFSQISVTYLSDIRAIKEDKEYTFETKDDLIEYEGKFYGDFTCFGTKCLHKILKKHPEANIIEIK